MGLTIVTCLTSSALAIGTIKQLVRKKVIRIEIKTNSLFNIFKNPQIFLDFIFSKQ